MNFDEWVELCKPILTNDGKIILFNDYGKDYEFIKRENGGEKYDIWTLKDCDGIFSIESGIHSFDRSGFFVSEKNEYAPPFVLNVCDVDNDDSWYSFWNKIQSGYFEL